MQSTSHAQSVVIEDVSAVGYSLTLSEKLVREFVLLKCCSTYLSWFHLDKTHYLPTPRKTSIISSWRIKSSPVLYSTLKDIGDFPGGKKLKESVPVQCYKMPEALG